MQGTRAWMRQNEKAHTWARATEYIRQLANMLILPLYVVPHEDLYKKYMLSITHKEQEEHTHTHTRAEYTRTVWSEKHNMHIGTFHNVHTFFFRSIPQRRLVITVNQACHGKLSASEKERDIEWKRKKKRGGEMKRTENIWAHQFGILCKIYEHFDSLARMWLIS